MKQQDGQEVEFGGQDASIAVWLYQHRSDPTPTPAEQALQINLPATWITETAPAGALISARIDHYATSAILFATPKADLLEDISLSEWLSDVKQKVKLLNAQNCQEGEIKTGRIGDRPTAGYELTGDIHGTAMRFRVIGFELNGCYCRLHCSTPAQISDWAQPNFENLVLKITSR
jgi:hypothetical protein